MKGILISILISSILFFLFGKVKYNGIVVDSFIIKWFLCLFFCTIASFVFGLPILGLVHIIKLL